MKKSLILAVQYKLNLQAESQTLYRPLFILYSPAYKVKKLYGLRPPFDA